MFVLVSVNVTCRVVGIFKLTDPSLLVRVKIRVGAFLVNIVFLPTMIT